jgi:hypothetical protein
VTWAAFIQLLAVIAKILDAVAWPLVPVAFFFLFRAQMAEILGNLPRLLNRVESLKLAGVEAVLSAQSAAVAGKSPEETARVSEAQVAAAVEVATQARDVSLPNIRKAVVELAEEYDRLRATMPSGGPRTVEMNRVVAKMRALSLASEHLLDELRTAAQPGRRLMATVILQVRPRVGEIDWLVDRFHNEKQPFLFFHAAIALQRLADIYGRQHRDALLQAISVAERAIDSFDGKPDPNTLRVLAETRLTLGWSAVPRPDGT